MLDQRYYWGTVRKAIVAFGNMFNNITIEKKGPNNTTIVQRVPLSYSPKQKFLARINQQPNVDKASMQVILPRMGFEMVAMDYDPNRMHLLLIILQFYFTSMQEIRTMVCK